jgi:hypothetical protein
MKKIKNGYLKNKAEINTFLQYVERNLFYLGI